MSTDPRNDRTAPLIGGVSQYDVDFVMPRLGVDLPLGIDPFLLFKSRDAALRGLHEAMVGVFNQGIRSVRDGEWEEAHRLFDFPEVAEIGLGYSETSKRGSGVGDVLRSLILETLSHSPELQQRGIRHVEEMQLFSAGIGPDRVSDITANILKSFLIEYTKRQCLTWNIPLVDGVPLSHVLDLHTGEWEDGFFRLPVSPVDGSAILLVPRRIVRTLPWINYDDFLRGEFAAYLKAKRTVARNEASGVLPRREGPRSKTDVVSITRADIRLVERYVATKEAEADKALPSSDFGLGSDADTCAQAETLKVRLASMTPGRDHAAEYQRLVLEILNFAFSPDLVDGQLEVRSIDGTERRDIVFTNESNHSFWAYMRAEHSNIFVMFETKNTNDLRPDALNQTATYLGDRVGRFGVIVTRQPVSEGARRKAISIWNDSGGSRKAILIWSDADLNIVIDLRCRGTSTARWVQDSYRSFRMSLQ